MRRKGQDEVVLSIFPTGRGLAYTCFEAPLSPIDWGLKRIRRRDKNVVSMATVVRLCETLHPDTIVIEDRTRSRRRERVRRLLTMIEQYAETESIVVARYARAAVRQTFREGGAINRYQIAQAIASYIPAFSSKLPRRPKLWTSEDERLSLFDAAALALTHFAVLPEEAAPP